MLIAAPAVRGALLRVTAVSLCGLHMLRGRGHLHLIGADRASVQRAGEQGAQRQQDEHHEKESAQQ